MVSSQKRGSRAAALAGALALGAVTAIGLRGHAGQQPTPVQPPAQALSLQSAFEQVANKLRPSVVHIQSQKRVGAAGFRQGADDDEMPFGFNFPGFPGGGRQFRMMPPGGGEGMRPRAVASGSGVIVRGDGYILTNDHVVDGADKVTVKLQDGREFTGEVKRDFRSDLALIKIDATGLPTAELADSDGVNIGQWAIAFGSPFGLNDTMTVGIVSSLHRRQGIGAGDNARLYPNLIQTDASINPGNSGGPLVDIYGRIVGINVAIESPSGGNVGIGFAIPANTARYVMDQLITKGKVTRGFLGLAPTSLTFDQQERYGVKQGALVMSVEDGTPAAKAGFRVEDVIVRYNNQPVTDEASLRDLVARTAPNASVEIVVRRGGQERTLNATIGQADEPKAAQDAPAESKDEPSRLGVRIANSDDAQARQMLKIEGDLPKGALVVEVVPGSPAAAAGIQPGDVIIRLNGKDIATSKELSEMARGLKDNEEAAAVIKRGKQTILAQISLD